MKRQTALYRCFSSGDVLLYVGISKNFELRFQQHAKVQPWWPEVHHQMVTWYDSDQEADDAETAAILAEKPLYNKAKVPLPPGDPVIMEELLRTRDAPEQLRQAIRQRQAAVMQARAAGWSKYRIGKVLGVGAPTVYSIISAAERERG